MLKGGRRENIQNVENWSLCIKKNQQPKQRKSAQAVTPGRPCRGTRRLQLPSPSRGSCPTAGAWLGGKSTISFSLAPLGREHGPTSGTETGREMGMSSGGAMASGRDGKEGEQGGQGKRRCWHGKSRAGPERGKWPGQNGSNGWELVTAPSSTKSCPSPF